MHGFCLLNAFIFFVMFNSNGYLGMLKICFGVQFSISNGPLSQKFKC